MVIPPWPILSTQVADHPGDQPCELLQGQQFQSQSPVVALPGKVYNATYLKGGFHIDHYHKI